MCNKKDMDNLIHRFSVIKKCSSDYDCNILTSKSAIDRILRGFHYTVKSTVLVPQRRNDVRTIDIRERYAEEFRRLEAETEHSNLVFIDEVGFCVVSRPKKGRSIVGSSPYVSVSAARSRNISVVAAMNKYGLIYHKIHNTAVNGEDFKTCLIELKNQCLAAGISDPVFILDKARIHHYKCLNQGCPKFLWSGPHYILFEFLRATQLSFV